MNEINGIRYIDLGYSHEELIFLLGKIKSGFTLSESQYDKLIKEIKLENISTFDKDYNKLNNLPNIDQKILDKVLELNLASNPDVARAIEEVVSNLNNSIKKLNEQKADKVHNHDNVYTKNEIDILIGNIDGDIDLTHYVRDEDLVKELLAYATIEYINAELEKYANKVHTHELTDINSIQDEFNKKANLDDVYNKEEINELLKNVDTSGNNGEHSHDEFLKKDEANNTYSKIEDVEALIELIDLLESTITENRIESNESIANIQSNLENKINLDKQDLESQINNAVSEINISLDNKADKNHTHDIYYSKSEVDNKLAQLSTGGSIDLEGYLKQEDLLEVQQNIEKLQSDIDNKADKNHDHNYSISDISGLQEVLDNKSNKDDSVEIPDNIMDTIDNKADRDHTHDNYADTNHIHQYEIDDIIGLQEAIDVKANKDELFTEEDILKIVEDNIDINIDPEHTHDEYALKNHAHDNYADRNHDHNYAEIGHEHDDYSLINHEHDIEEIVNLQNILSSKAESSMVYTKEQIDKKLVDISSGGSIDLEGFIKQSDLAEGLATKSDLGHRHSIAEISGLQEALDNKAGVANLATKAELEEGLAAKSNIEHTHEQYALQEHTHSEFYTKKETGDFVNDLLDLKTAAILAEADIYVDTAISKLTQDAPEDLNTFAEIATVITKQNEQINSDKVAIDNALAGKADITHHHSEYATLEGEAEREIFTTTELTVDTLGGIKAGSDLNGLTVKEILNKLLYPYIAPTISVQGTPNGGVFEKGDIQTITNVKVIITKKSEKIAKIEILQGSNVLAVQEDTSIAEGGTFNYSVNVPVNSVDVQLTGKVTDVTGTVRQSKTASFSFVYPYYIGVCGENDTVNEELIKGLEKRIETKGTKNISYKTVQQKMIFAYPKSYGIIKRILDPNSFDVTDTFIRTEIKITGLDGTSQSYYVYVNNASTVSGFTMTFSY